MTHQYPKPMPWIKTCTKVLILLMILLNGFLMFTIRAGDYGSTLEYMWVLTFLALFPLIIFWVLYSWCDVRIEENGIWVEYLFRDLFVPWEDIVNVRFIGSFLRFTGVWFIKTRDHNLTWFHSVYGLFYTRSLSRGFVIHPQIKGEKVLIRQMKRSAKVRSAV